MYDSYEALNGYRIMWLYVMFDLPVESKAQRRRAALFRKSLIKDGFAMHQFSVYIRHCASHESAAVHIKRVTNMVPIEGSVSILKVTDKQFGDTIRVVGKRYTPPPATPVPLEFF